MRSPGQVSYILSALRNLKGLSRPKHLVEGIFSYHVLSDVNFVLGGEDGKIFHEKNLSILSQQRVTSAAQPPLFASHSRLTNGWMVARVILKNFRWTSSSSREIRYRTLMYDVSRFQKCAFCPNPITSNFTL